MMSFLHRSLGRPASSVCDVNAVTTRKGEFATASSLPQRAAMSQMAAFATALVLLSAGAARADYVGSLTNRLFLDPDNMSSVLNGYQNGDEFAYIMETSPADTGSTNGNA